MNHRYILLRLRTFSREYTGKYSQFLHSSGAWLWRFSIDNIRYLYQGEIHQLNHLGKTVRSQREYIDFIASSPFNKPLDNNPPASDESALTKTLTILFRIVLMPFVFIVYWARRYYRLARQQQFELTVSKIYPTEDMQLPRGFKGVAASLYLVPERAPYFPRGLVIFRYRLKTAEKNPSPLLYIDPGVGFSSEYTIALPYDSRQAEQELLLELPPHCKLLELYLGSLESSVEFTDASMTELNLFRTARYLKKHYQYDTNAILHALFIRKLPGIRRIRAQKIGYTAWYQKYCLLSDTDRKAINSHIKAMDAPPHFSIVVCVDNLAPALLEQTLKSVVRQYYPHWELLITCRNTPDAHTTAVLNQYDRYDERTRILIDPQIAAITTNISHALEKATSPYIIYLEQGDLLAEHALYIFADRQQHHPDSLLFYSDHDHIDQYGVQSDPCLKPDWNYEYFLGKNYLSYLVCYQTEALRLLADIEHLDPLNDGSRLNLNIAEQASEQQIQHIPYILLHHRIKTEALTSKPTITQHHDTAALDEHLKRTGQLASVESVTYGHHIKYPAPSPEPLVSLIILTRDRVALLSSCINGILEHTQYQNIEIILIDNGSIEEATLAYMDALSKNERVKIIRHPIDFNFSELNNFALQYVNGDYIGLINNDIAVIDPNWLDEMMGQLLKPDVGIVGAKLYYNNDTVQHAGVIVGLGGVAGHAFRHEPRNYNGYNDRLVLAQELSCVTAACLLTKKDIYNEVGGLDEVNLRVAFNDVDFCLKVREKGYKVIWTPFAELYHLESASRGNDLSSENIHRWNAEYTFMRNKWQHVLEWDPYYNPNLAITDEDFSLAQPPRLIHPWDRYRY